MDNLDIVRVVGLALFAFAVIINVFSFLYVLIKSTLRIQSIKDPSSSSKASPLQKQGHPRYTIYRIAYIDKTIWYYVTLFSICFILTFLYAALWQGQGTVTTITMKIVNWARWVAFSIIAALFIGYTTYHLVEEDRISNDLNSSINMNSRKSMNASSDSLINGSFYLQIFFAVLFAVFSMIFIYFATLSQTTSTRILSIIFSCISAAVVVVFLFIPRNSFFQKIYYLSSSSSATPAPSSPSTTYRKSPINNPDKPSVVRTGYPMSIQRIILYTFVLLFFLLNILIWLISDSNEIITNGNGLTLLYEAVSYLITDSIFVYTATIWALVVALKQKFEVETIN